MIRIDLAGGTVDVDLTPAEIAARLREAVPPRRTVGNRWLRRYRSLVTSANTGAVLRELEPDLLPAGAPDVSAPDPAPGPTRSAGPCHLSRQRRNARSEPVAPAPAG